MAETLTPEARARLVRFANMCRKPDAGEDEEFSSYVNGEGHDAVEDINAALSQIDALAGEVERLNRVRAILEAYADDGMDKWRALGEPVQLRSSHVALEMIDRAALESQP